MPVNQTGASNPEPMSGAPGLTGTIVFTPATGTLPAGSPSARPGEAGNSVHGQVTGAVIQAGTISGGVVVQTGSPYTVPLPHQLAPGPPVLADRTTELGALDGLLSARPGSGGQLLVMVSGPAGIGKTALALWWLHTRTDEFPDGQLHADLGGTSRSGELPADVLARWLRALGVPADWIPASTPELTALWRSVTAGRRLAILAENPATVAAVQMLLPGPGGSTVMVTTRTRLSATAGAGARFLHLDPLPGPAAAELLSRIAGQERVAAEPAAAQELLAWSGGIPLAVCTAAGQVAAAPGQPIAGIAAGLTAGHASTGGPDQEAGMRTRLNASYAALDPAAARAYRLLSLHPGPDFSPGLAAAILGKNPEQTQELTQLLMTACLLEPAGQGRYRFHDLIRDHARSLARRADTGPERHAVTGQIVGWYLSMTTAAGQLLQPYRDGLRRDAAAPPGQDMDAAGDTPQDWLGWLDREHRNLEAVVFDAAGNGHPAAAWQLADAMWPLFLYRSHHRAQLQVTRAGLAAARACGDTEGRARMLDQAGIAALHLASLDEAAGYFRAAGALWRRLGNHRKSTGTTRRLGWIAQARGDLNEAISLYETALEKYRKPDAARPRQAALTLTDLGGALTAAGRQGDAVPVLREAAALLAAEPHPDPYNQARIQAALGQALTARPAEAEPLLTSALDVMTGLGVLPAQAGILQALGQAAARAGHGQAARDRYQQALALLPPGHPRAAGISQALDELADGTSPPAAGSGRTERR